VNKLKSPTLLLL